MNRYITMTVEAQDELHEIIDKVVYHFECSDVFDALDFIYKNLDIPFKDIINISVKRRGSNF